MILKKLIRNQRRDSGTLYPIHWISFWRIAMENSQSFGEKAFINGDRYVGNFKGSLPDGEGKYTWSDGTIYQGEWSGGKMTGKGQFRWTSGASYEGDFSSGYLHGVGTFTEVNGSIYRGAWRVNVQHGFGRKQYCNSDIYEGCWKEGAKEGSGNYDWNTGDAYIGNWKGGKFCGRGVMKWANGDIFDGFWLDGYRHGSGFYRFADGGYYFGTWSKGLKDGHGTFYPFGSELPYLPNWYSSVGYYDDRPSVSSLSSATKSEKFKVPRWIKRSVSYKCSIGRLFRNFDCVSDKPTSLEREWCLADSIKQVPSRENFGTLSFTSEKVENEVGDCSDIVYIREYMQGVLIKERVGNNATGISNKNNPKNAFPGNEAKKCPGEIIFKGHKSYNLMLNLQLGIRYTVGKINPVPKRDVRPSDFGPQARLQMYFPCDGSKFTPSHRSIGFYWRDYCPMAFRNLREMFKIDAADYMMSICGSDGLKEISSPGKSGSIFYLSQDERFIIKTLRRSEVKIFLKMLPNYYKHVRAHENTLITKFFGLHQMTLKGGQKVRFVVMGNMFCTELRIHRRFDLKGSTEGRITYKDEIDENTTLKDLDLTYVFYMEKSWRESLFRQISMDCGFLESENIIDYSLLLGVHFRAPDHLKALLRPPDAIQVHSSLLEDDGPSSDVQLSGPPTGLPLVAHEPGLVNTVHVRGQTLRAESKGNQEVDLLLPDTGRMRVQLGVNMPAQAKRKLCTGAEEPHVDPFEVYDVVLYLGIIDILQNYNAKKKIEHAYKSMHFDPTTISSVEPKLYSERFINFLGNVFPDQT